MDSPVEMIGVEGLASEEVPLHVAPRRAGTLSRNPDKTSHVSLFVTRLDLLKGFVRIIAWTLWLLAVGNFKAHLCPAVVRFLGIDWWKNSLHG